MDVKRVEGGREIKNKRNARRSMRGRRRGNQGETRKKEEYISVDMNYSVISGAVVLLHLQV